MYQDQEYWPVGFGPVRDDGDPDPLPDSCRVDYGHDGEGSFTGPVLILIAGMIAVLSIIAWVFIPHV